MVAGPCSRVLNHKDYEPSCDTSSHPLSIAPWPGGFFLWIRKGFNLQTSSLDFLPLVSTLKL